MARRGGVPAILLALFATQTSSIRRDYSCFCQTKSHASWAGGDGGASCRRCIYAMGPCQEAITREDMYKFDSGGWTYMHHAAAAGNIKAAQVLIKLHPKILTPESSPRLHGKAPAFPKKSIETLEGLKNVWGWQPIHVAAAFNQSEFISWIMEVPDGLNSLTLRRHLDSEDRYNRTAFIVALDTGSLGAAEALTSHPFASPDIEAAVTFGIHAGLRALGHSRGTFEWYKGFVEKRRRETAERIVGFYDPWPIVKILRNASERKKMNVSRISAWPPVFYVPHFSTDDSVCEAVMRDGAQITSRESTFGPQSMFGGVPRSEITGYMQKHDMDHNGVLEKHETEEFIREIMNRETGGVKELLGFKMPTGRIAVNLGLDVDGDGRIEYTGFERFSEEKWDLFNKNILQESEMLEARVIRTQQSARLTTSVAFKFSKYAIQKLNIPAWVDVQFQVIHSIPPGEHYGHHDDGAHRIFTVFLYCKAATVGGKTAFPFALAIDSLNNTGEISERDQRNIQAYRSMGFDQAYRRNVHLHEMCEVKRDCCHPDCHAMHQGPTDLHEKECQDDEQSLRANLISAGILNFFQGNATCAKAVELRLCHHERTAYHIRILCPKACQSCRFAMRERQEGRDKVPRVVPTTGTVRSQAKAGDVLIWPNYEHRPNGNVFRLMEAGHCGCPVRGGDKWSANLWFRLPVEFLAAALKMVIRDSLMSGLVEGLTLIPPNQQKSYTLKQLDNALGNILKGEKLFLQENIGLPSEKTRISFRKCHTKEYLETASGVDLLREALILEHTSFSDNGARRMGHYMHQFVWKDLKPRCISNQHMLRKRQRCESWRADGCASGYTEWQGDNSYCPSVCGACGLPTQDNCEDTNSECSQMAAEGKCRTSERMRTECAASCGTCSRSTALRALEI